MVVCPECDGTWNSGEVVKGEIITCPDCGVELEVLNVEPLQIAPAPEEEEDWGE
ncbi:MAG: lysine biosynthesis protein LysW [Firmicutes bacterium]|nr:lysine biosynthesis protein LysW [Bacillota bacterium]